MEYFLPVCVCVFVFLDHNVPVLARTFLKKKPRSVVTTKKTSMRATAKNSWASTNFWTKTNLWMTIKRTTRMMIMRIKSKKGQAQRSQTYLDCRWLPQRVLKRTCMSSIRRHTIACVAKKNILKSANHSSRAKTP